MTTRTLSSLLIATTALGLSCAFAPVEQPKPHQLKPPPGKLVTRQSEPLTQPPADTQTDPVTTGGDGFGDRGYLADLTAQWRDSDKSARIFLTLAVKRGLYLDGIGSRLAMDIHDERGGRLWVGKCPICGPVQDAFRVHAGFVQADNLGHNLAGAALHPIAEALDANQEVRHRALGQAVNRWVKDATRAFEVSDADQKRLQQELAGDRKQGMSLKPDAFMYCPSCDGATSQETIL